MHFASDTRSVRESDGGLPCDRSDLVLVRYDSRWSEIKRRSQPCASGGLAKSLDQGSELSRGLALSRLLACPGMPTGVAIHPLMRSGAAGLPSEVSAHSSASRRRPSGCSHIEKSISNAVRAVAVRRPSRSSLVSEVFATNSTTRIKDASISGLLRRRGNAPLTIPVVHC
jgi:hypothetical protein